MGYDVAMIFHISVRSAHSGLFTLFIFVQMVCFNTLLWLRRCCFALLWPALESF